MNPTDPVPNPPASPAVDPDDFKAMLIGAGFIFAVSFIPYISLACCLPQILGVLLTIHLFTRWYQMTLTYGQGIRLGMLTAMLGSVAFWVVVMALWLGFGYLMHAKENEAIMMKIMSKASPEMLQAFKQAMEAQKTQEIGLPQILLGLCATVVNACICGLIGGALGAALFKRGRPVG
ncbi:MAG: hypothetical protein JWR19_4504 [Pedosphaera sp.]|nr:hypothetical protein [Pedosphaera sp.]